MKQLLQCMFAPRLKKVYKQGFPDSLYQPLPLEKWADKIITSACTIMNIGICTSPFICMYVYRKGFTVIDENKYGLLRLFGGIGCLITLAYVMRGIGRASNQVYIDFLKALSSPMTDKKSYLQGIRKYDFEFYAWPATFIMDPKVNPTWRLKHPFLNCANDDLPLYQRLPIQILAFIATHAFGLRLIYPGSFFLIGNLFVPSLYEGRTQLVELFEGQRTKLKTADGNEIDTMFVDNRERSPKGKILVICSEGNSGFYEIGLMTTPARGGYSALGWNHPGFGASTGVPYPSQEHNAIDAVMQYAINELEFKPENIVTYGWSIGGYSASWAAVNYPVKAVLLDATFDDLLPLAENVMPSSWSLLVKEVVRSYVDLHVVELLKKYDGPVQLIRRTEDEIICLSPGILPTNRGNFLVARLIEHRYPLDKGLDATAWKMALLKYVAMPESKRPPIDSGELNEYEKRAVRLINKYMRDFRSTHCVPLPLDQFENMMTKVTSK